jgi:hypothetical protein
MSRDQVNESAETIELAGGGESDEPMELEGELIGAEETVDGMPVLAEVHAVDAAPGPSLPAVQTAAAVATGFVAGAATLALVRRHSARKLARAAGRSRRGAEGLSIVGSRSFLVDVHLISKPGE